ncbi:MAG: hypothetical protein KBD94_04475 [Pyrinomonadaceae bacterium]|nr:hypothetical protein [Pyrinomonadaceae bacterium]
MPKGQLEKILVEDWQKATERRSDRTARLIDRISHLSTRELTTLVSLYLECAEGTSRGKDEFHGPFRFSKDAKKIETDTAEISLITLADFLHALMLAEYRIDDLLYHPPALRFSRLDQFAKSVKLKREDFKRIYLNWHAGLRKRVLSESK